MTVFAVEPEALKTTIAHVLRGAAQLLEHELSKPALREYTQVITKTRGRQHQLALLVWGSDYFDPNSNAQAFCSNPDNGDSPKLKTLAWRSSWQDAELTKMVAANVKELDSRKRIAAYERMEQIHQDRSPFAFILQQQEVATMGKGVAGFRVGPMSDLTDYAPITKT